MTMELLCATILIVGLALQTGGGAAQREPGLYATFQTSMGNIVCKLFEKEAPKTVDNFVGLATGRKEWTHPATQQKMHTPLYSGTVFHRVIPNFMIQGGDPLGSGRGGPGYQFEDEFQSGMQFDVPGRLAMANIGPNTNGSQFFITEVPTPHLNNKHTIFGQVVSGQELVSKIVRAGNSVVKLEKVAIERVGADGKVSPVTAGGTTGTSAKKPGAAAKKRRPARKSPPTTGAKKAITR